MAIFMKEIGKMVINMDMESLNGVMGVNIKVIMKII